MEEHDSSVVNILDYLEFIHILRTIVLHDSHHIMSLVSIVCTYLSFTFKILSYDPTRFKKSMTLF